MVGRKITIIASPLLKEWKLKSNWKDGVLLKRIKIKKTKGVWIRLNEPFANELEWFIPIQSVQNYFTLIWNSWIKASDGFKNCLTYKRNMAFFSIIKGLFLLFLSGYIIFFALNPKYLLDRMSEITTAQHDHLVNTRLSADSNIRHILSKMIFTTNADRAWLIEFHNGSKNLTTGLPFLFGSMRIEEVRDSISNVDEDYADFSLSKYKLVAKVLDDGYFYGGLDDIQKIDQRLYYKFQANDISEIALLTLYDGEKPAGIIGLSFCNGKKMDKQLVGKHIRSSGIKVATLLSQIND